MIEVVADGSSVVVRDRRLATQDLYPLNQTPLRFLLSDSIDLMRDRTSGAVLSGDPSTPTQTTELWTFARHTGGDWKLSAIQET